MTFLNFYDIDEYMYRTFIDISIKLLPVFILIFIGLIARISGLIKEGSIEDLKKIIVNISLPAILFTSFLGIDLKFIYIFIIIPVFALCVLLYLSGLSVGKLFKLKGGYTPFLMTGFEFGMMGAVFFGTAFGLDKTAYIAIIAIGHEFFIWFVYVTLLKRRSEEKNDPFKILVKFFKTPVIISIIAGILLNLSGIKVHLDNFFISKAVLQSFQHLSGLTVPLILIIIGYNLKIDINYLKSASFIIILRLFLVLLSGLLINILIFRLLLGLDEIFSSALFTFLILPPPFILPLFIKKENENDIKFVNNVLISHTFLSIIIFSIYIALHSAKIFQSF